MQSSAAEEGSPVGMLNVAFMLQRGMGYSGPDRYALAYDLNLRAARLEHYADGLVDAAALVYDGDRYEILALPCVLSITYWTRGAWLKCASSFRSPDWQHSIVTTADATGTFSSTFQS